MSSPPILVPGIGGKFCMLTNSKVESTFMNSVQRFWGKSRESQPLHQAPTTAHIISQDSRNGNGKLFDFILFNGGTFGASYFLPLSEMRSEIRET